MIWIQSYGSKYHILARQGIAGSTRSFCGINLTKEETKNPPEKAKCKRCLKLYEAGP